MKVKHHASHLDNVRQTVAISRYINYSIIYFDIKLLENLNKKTKEINSVGFFFFNQIPVF